MIDKFVELQHRYNTSINAYNNKQLLAEEGIKELEILLADIIAAGEFIEDEEQRLFLSSYSRQLGDAVFELSNGNRYPSIRIRDFAKKYEQEFIGFVNRVHEMAYITNRYSPLYLLLNAPIGYGKTRLLENIKSRLQYLNWTYFYLSLKIEQSYTIQTITENIFRQLKEPLPVNLATMTPQHYGFAVAIALLKTIRQDQKQFVLIVDNAEVLEDSVVKDLLGSFILAIEEGLNVSAVRLRLICSGRHLLQWKQFSPKLPLEIISLVPFNFSAIYEIVEQYAATSAITTSVEYRQDFSAFLMFMTGGHPAAILGILQRNFGVPLSLINEKEVQFYSDFVMPVLNNIQTNFSSKPELFKILKDLSIFRFYNLSLLQKIIEAKLINYTGNVIDMESQLTSTYLVSRKQGILQDDIVRPLFAIQLRKELLYEKFASLCRATQEIYESYLEETTYHAHSVALEVLYHGLQYAYYAGNCTAETRTALRTSFFGKDGPVEKYLARLLRKNESYDILQNLKNILKEGEDWEFRFTVNFFLRKDEHYTDEPYQLLLNKVENFINTHQ